MNKKTISIIMVCIMLLSVTSTVYADEIITISGNVYAKISIPSTIDLGDLLIGEQTEKRTLFSIDTDPAGATFNLTLMNGTENAIFNVITPPPYNHNVPLNPDTITQFDGDNVKQGNYTIEVISKKVGALSYLVKMQFNESQFNYTRY